MKMFKNLFIACLPTKSISSSVKELELWNWTWHIMFINVNIEYAPLFSQIFSHDVHCTM